MPTAANAESTGLCPFAEIALKPESRAGLGGQVIVIRLTEIRQSDAKVEYVEYKDEEVRVAFGSVSPTVKKPKGSGVRKLVYLPGASPYRTQAPGPPGLVPDRRHGGSRARKCL
jgi:hypothetical protein